MTGLSQTQYAKHRGVSQPYICKMVGLGKIPVGPDGKIDPAVADAALNAMSDPGKAGVVAHHAAKRGRAPAPATPESAAPSGDLFAGQNYSDSKRRDAAAAADLREMERDRTKGELIERRAYAKGCHDAGSTLGKELDGMVHRLAPLVAGESSVTRCRELIAAEVFRARDAIADMLEALAAQDRTKQ